MKPEILLIIGILLIVLLAFVFWPGKGLLALFRRAGLNTRKTQLEDALKFLFDCEYKKNSCSLHSVAGNLNITSNKAAMILEDLETMGLIQSVGELFELTDAGRSYALRVIRVHRIWEKYLADETSVDQRFWHQAADLKEHTLTSAAADKLAGRIGNPVFDPHGDPIPTTEGELPAHKGTSLAALKEGEIGRIIHIEDEPASIYDQLIALGLYPGMQVYVLDVTEGKITFAAEGEEKVLTSLFASAITVETIPGSEPVTQKHDMLSSLKPGERAEVIGISQICRGQQRRRLLDLGIIPGTIITPEIKSPSGDPTGYLIMGTVIGIRKHQADMIFINKLNE